MVNVNLTLNLTLNILEEGLAGTSLNGSPTLNPTLNFWEGTSPCSDNLQILGNCQDSSGIKLGVIGVHRDL